MKTSPNERLKEVREALGLLQKEFAKGLVMTQAGYSDVERNRGGNMGVSKRILYLAKEKYNVNPDYIENGNPPMFLHESNIGERLRIFRNTIGEPLENMASATGIDIHTLESYENDGVVPPIDIINKLRDIYYLNVDWLITGKGQPQMGAITSGGDKIREIMRRLSMTIIELAEASGLKGKEKYEFIRDVQAGRPIRQDVVQNIIDQYPEVNPNYMLRGENPEKELMQQHLNLNNRYIRLLEKRIKELELRLQECIKQKSPGEPGQKG
jgi:transcriptional regulator with XRE-family HTH domain